MERFADREPHFSRFSRMETTPDGRWVYDQAGNKCEIIALERELPYTDESSARAFGMRPITSVFPYDDVPEDCVNFPEEFWCCDACWYGPDDHLLKDQGDKL